MACCYDEDGNTSFASLFKEQAEVKREHVKPLLRKHEGSACLWVIEKSDRELREQHLSPEVCCAVGERGKQVQ